MRCCGIRRPDGPIASLQELGTFLDHMLGRVRYIDTTSQKMLAMQDLVEATDLRRKDTHAVLRQDTQASLGQPSRRDRPASRACQEKTRRIVELLQTQCAEKV